MVSAARMALVSHRLRCPAAAVALSMASGGRALPKVSPKGLPSLPRIGSRLRTERRKLLSAVQNNNTGHTSLQDLEQLLQVKQHQKGSDILNE